MPRYSPPWTVPTSGANRSYSGLTNRACQWWLRVYRRTTLLRLVNSGEIRSTIGGSTRDSGYDWWIRRAKALLQLVDLVRLDHFRGFAGYWEIPSSAPTAESGRWVSGPAEGLLSSLAGAVATSPQRPVLPLIAEDLGVVTPDVTRLLKMYDLPGMRVLQFGFTGYQEDFLPHNYPENCVAYTGTHDNDTSRGWFSGASDPERRAALAYLHSSESTIVRDMISAIWRSRAELTVVPVQDILDLGSEARMNYPGRSEGYWEWRMSPDALSESLAR